MATNRIFNIECPGCLEETVLCLNPSDFERLKEEPCIDNCDKYKLDKGLYRNGRNFEEIHGSLRQHVLQCRECSQEYINFLGKYVKWKINERQKQDRDIPSLLEEVNRLPEDRRAAFYLSCLREADSKYLNIINVKSVTKYKPMDDAIVGCFEKTSKPSMELKQLKKIGLDYNILLGVN